MKPAHQLDSNYPEVEQYYAKLTPDMALAAYKLLHSIDRERCFKCDTNTDYNIQEEGTWKCSYAKCGFAITADALMALKTLFIPIKQKDRDAFDAWREEFSKVVKFKPDPSRVCVECGNEKAVVNVQDVGYLCTPHYAIFKRGKAHGSVVSLNG